MILTPLPTSLLTPLTAFLPYNNAALSQTMQDISGHHACKFGTEVLLVMLLAILIARGRALSIMLYHRIWTIVIMVGVVLLIATQGSSAQEADDVQPNTPLFLQADKLIGNMSEQGFTRELIGNVVLTQGAVRITCSRAMHYVEQNRAELFGNVVLTQGATAMKAAQGVYDGTLRSIAGSGNVELFDGKSLLKARTGTYSTAFKVARFFSTVRIENDSLIITCDTLEYHRTTQNSYATGMVTARGKFTSAYLQGDSLVHIPSEKYTRLSNYVGHGQAMVSQIDTVQTDTGKTNVGNIDSLRSAAAEPILPAKERHSNLKKNIVGHQRLDTLCIAGNLLEAFRRDSNEMYYATGEVQMSRRQLAGRAERAIYEKTSSLIRLFSATSATMPILWLDSTQLRGDSIRVQLRDKRLERVTAYVHAFAATKNDTLHEERIDQLSGEVIIIQMLRDTIQSISAEGNAFNLYFAQSENEQGASEPDGAVRNAADTVRILFNGGSLDNILWRGKVEGEYIPEHIAREQLQTLRLKGFEWFTHRPYLWRGMTQGIIRPKGSAPQQQNNSRNIRNNTNTKHVNPSSSTRQKVPSGASLQPSSVRKPKE